MEDRRNAGENCCNSGDGTDQTGTILDVNGYDSLWAKWKIILRPRANWDLFLINMAEIQYLRTKML